MLSRQQLRIAVFSTAVIAFAAPLAAHSPRRNTTPAATDTEIKTATSCPFIAGRPPPTA